MIKTQNIGKKEVIAVAIFEAVLLLAYFTLSNLKKGHWLVVLAFILVELICALLMTWLCLDIFYIPKKTRKYFDRGEYERGLAFLNLIPTKLMRVYWYFKKLRLPLSHISRAILRVLLNIKATRFYGIPHEYKTPLERLCLSRGFWRRVWDSNPRA